MQLDAVIEPGDSGQYEIFVDGETVAKRGGNLLTRLFGGGWPVPEDVVAQIESRVGKTV